MLNWHEMAVDATIDDLKSSRQGLSAGEVRSHLARIRPQRACRGEAALPMADVGSLAPMEQNFTISSNPM